MSALNDTLLTIVLILGSGLMVVGIIVLYRVGQAVKSMQSQIGDLNQHLLPLIDRASTLSERATETIEIFTEQREGIAESVNNIRKVTANIHHLEQMVQDEIEPGLTSFLTMLRGFRKGIQSFSDQWRRSR